MSIGIYALYWAKQDLIYIGQSKEIETRFYEHLRLLRDNKHCNYKINKAYKLYGEPSTEILVECDLESLDTLEISLIEEFDSLCTGLNILPGGIGTGKYTDHGASKFSKDELLFAVELLTNPELSLNNIKKATGISTPVLSSLANLSAHQWIFQDEELKARLIIARDIRKINAKVKSPHYGKELLSPTQEVFSVYNITEFATAHNLSASKVGEVLNKIRLSHKGWKIKE